MYKVGLLCVNSSKPERFQSLYKGLQLLTSMCGLLVMWQHKAARCIDRKQAPSSERKPSVFTCGDGAAENLSLAPNVVYHLSGHAHTHTTLSLHSSLKTDPDRCCVFSQSDTVQWFGVAGSTGTSDTAEGKRFPGMWLRVRSRKVKTQSEPRVPLADSNLNQI